MWTIYHKRRNLWLNVNFASNKNDENKSDAYVRTIAKLLQQIPNFVSNAFKWNMCTDEQIEGNS